MTADDRRQQLRREEDEELRVILARHGVLIEQCDDELVPLKPIPLAVAKLETRLDRAVDDIKRSSQECATGQKELSERFEQYVKDQAEERKEDREHRERERKERKQDRRWIIGVVLIPATGLVLTAMGILLTAGHF